jgi:hypothetical protein
VATTNPAKTKPPKGTTVKVKDKGRKCAEGTTAKISLTTVKVSLTTVKIKDTTVKVKDADAPNRIRARVK